MKKLTNKELDRRRGKMYSYIITQTRNQYRTQLENHHIENQTIIKIQDHLNIHVFIRVMNIIRHEIHEKINTN
jgi:hypothetical protein